MSNVETKLSEIRYRTSDPKKMLGKFVARRVLKTWQEDFQDKDTGEIVTVERNDILFEKGTYIDQKLLESITFYLNEGSVTEIEVSNQKRMAVAVKNECFYPYKAVVKFIDKKKTFLLYAVSVANALMIINDFVELNFDGRFYVSDIKTMDYCVILVDNLKTPAARKYDIDMAYLKNEISMEEFVEATCDNIRQENPDNEEETDNKEQKKFYQINAHIILSDEKEGDETEDHIFIVHTYSAVRANMLIEKYMRDKQEEMYLESLSHPERTFVRRDIHSFIEEAKTIPVGYFIPRQFSQAYINEDDC